MNARALGLVALLVSCGGTYYVPTESAVGSMTVKQARDSLADLKGVNIYYSGSPVRLEDVRVTVNRLVVTDANGKQSVFRYRDLPQIAVDTFDNRLKLSDRDFLRIFTKSRDNVANAFYVLQQNAIRSKKAADEYDLAFAASLAAYRRQAASNGALPEAAVKYKVQAEGAVRDKDFDDGADLYAAALNVAPWWPAGHFNRALVLGELEEYETARREMGYYLQLVPEAANARAAQDKIYQWERLESR